VRLVEAGDVLFNGKLHRVVHLGGKGDVGGIQPGKCIVNGLVLLLVLCRGSVHAVQAFAVSGEQTQRQLPAHLGTHGGVQRFGHGVVIVGLAGIKDAAVTGVCPDGPHHAGGSKGDAGSIVDLTAGGLDGGIQQLLLGGVLAVLCPVDDLDIIQAADDDGGCHHHRKDAQTAANPPHPAVQPVPAGSRTQAVTPAFFVTERFLHWFSPAGRALHSARPALLFVQTAVSINRKKRAPPHAFSVYLTVPRMFTAPVYKKSVHCRTVDSRRTSAPLSPRRM